MPNPATTSDIEARWRPLNDQETVNAEAYLDDAWWLLTARRPTLEADVTAGTVTEGNVIRVVAAMVKRILMNPGGFDQEQIDDWAGRRNKLVADGVLRIDPDELADITPGRRRQRSVRLVAYGDA